MRFVLSLAAKMLLGLYRIDAIPYPHIVLFSGLHGTAIAFSRAIETTPQLARLSSIQIAISTHLQATDLDLMDLRRRCYASRALPHRICRRMSSARAWPRHERLRHSYCSTAKFRKGPCVREP
jgi:hypothetical protein